MELRTIVYGSLHITLSLNQSYSYVINRNMSLDVT